MLLQNNCDQIHVSKFEDLESPYLSRTLPINLQQDFVRWETSRGCPYRCNFCQFKSEGVRPINAPQSRLMKELELFHVQQVKEIHVLDPIFNLKPSHFLPIIQKIENLGMSATFYFQCRLELLLKPEGKDFLEFCRRYKNIRLEFGVQTFNKAESDAVLRANQFDQMDKAIVLLQEYSIPFDLHLIFGLPNQTMADFQASYEKARKCKPYGLYLYPLNLLKGTELYLQAAQLGYEWDENAYNLFTKSNWMTSWEVDELKSFAQRVNDQSKRRRSSTLYPSFPEKKRIAA